MTDNEFLEVMLSAAIDAGRAAYEIYRGEFDVQRKADDSPVTTADHAAELIILERLNQAASGLSIVAEEQVARGLVPVHGADFILVDPLDGTKEFIQRRGDFTVNIAVIRGGSPVLGVVYAPAVSALFAGNAIDRRAFRSAQEPNSVGLAPREPIHVRPVPAEGLTAVASRSHRTSDTDAYLARYKIANMISVGSSLKFCLVASGDADLYPRLGTTMEWDTAAGHAVLVAAGGSVVQADGSPLRYGKLQFRNPWFIASGAADVLPVSGE